MNNIEDAIKTQDKNNTELYTKLNSLNRCIVHLCGEPELDPQCEDCDKEILPANISIVERMHDSNNAMSYQLSRLSKLIDHLDKSVYAPNEPSVVMNQPHLA